MSQTFSYQRRVTWSDCDAAGFWHFTAPLRFVEEAEVALLREAGALAGLYGQLPRVHVKVRYHRPARFDQEVRVQLAIARVGRSSVNYEFRIEVDGALAAEGGLGAAFVGEGPLSQPIPPPERERLESWMAGDRHGAAGQLSPLPSQLRNSPDVAQGDDVGITKPFSESAAPNRPSGLTLRVRP